MTKQLTEALVKQWLALVNHTFDIREIWYDIGIDTPEGKSHLRVILYRFEHQEPPLVVSVGSGKYRKTDTDLVPMPWQAADSNKTLPLLFPFGEHNYCKIFTKSIIIVAGSKNVGKTAYLYNFIKLNMTKFIIDLFNSETSPDQMNERFCPLAIPNPSPFNVYERYDNFADVIHPDHISVIDYLDFNSEVYLVGTEIDLMFRKLNKGVAIIGLQKPPPTKVLVRGVEKMVDRDLAYGGGFTAKRAILYITMSANRLKLLYVKTPTKRIKNPNNMTFSFNIANDGVTFDNIQQKFGDD